MTDQGGDSPLAIRRADTGDVQAVSAFLRDVWRHTYAPRHGLEMVEAITRRWHSEERMLADVVEADSLFLVAELEGRIVGHAFLQQRSGPEAQLRRLYVAPDCQGQGIGGRLVDQLLGDLGSDVRTVELEVNVLGAQAIGFYRANGFVECGQTSHCGGCNSTIAALIMRRFVGPVEGGEEEAC